MAHEGHCMLLVLFDRHHLLWGSLAHTHLLQLPLQLWFSCLCWASCSTNAEERLCVFLAISPMNSWYIRSPCWVSVPSPHLCWTIWSTDIKYAPHIYRIVPSICSFSVGVVCLNILYHLSRPWSTLYHFTRGDAVTAAIKHNGHKHIKSINWCVWRCVYRCITQWTLNTQTVTSNNQLRFCPSSVFINNKS